MRLLLAAVFVFALVASAFGWNDKGHLFGARLGSA
jgi:hypothetical protein